MKAVVLASLLCVGTIACGMELPAGYADGIESLQRTLQEAIDTPMSRNFQPNAASCPWTCTEPEFFLPAVQALSSCTAAQTALRVGITTANSTASIDATWTTFCASDCFTAAQTIPPKYYCCLGDLGGAFFGLNRGCAKNANTNRFCGAELLNIGGVKCAGTTEGNCAGSGTSCEWYAAEGRCAFKPVAAALDGICSPCIREYIETFPSGGIDTPASRNSIVAAYTAYCTKIQGDYCVITGGYDYQFRKADRLTNSELTTLCGESDASVKKRLCYKQVQGSIAAGLRSSIQGSYATCIGQNQSASSCLTAAGANAGISLAIDRLTNMMCTSKSANSYCFALETQAPLASNCSVALLTSNTCANCSTELTATAASMGCCLGAYAISGNVATAGVAASARGLSDARALNFAGVVNRTNTSVPFISDAVMSQVVANTATLNATLKAFSPLGRFNSTCGIAPTNETSIDTVSSACFNPVPATPLTLTIRLNVSATALMDAAVVNYAKERVVVDLTNRLGITAESVVSVSFVTSTRTISAAGQTGRAAADIVVVLNIGSSAEAAMLKLEVAAQIAAGSLSMPLLATELAVNCPNCLSNTYSPIVASSSLSIGRETTAPGSPPTNGAASHTLMVAASALAALLFAMM